MAQIVSGTVYAWDGKCADLNCLTKLSLPFNKGGSLRFCTRATVHEPSPAQPAPRCSAVASCTLLKWKECFSKLADEL